MIVRGFAVEPTPWANGRGTTRELHVARDEAGAPLWRLSMALVEGSGEFSSLPGVARTLMLVDGDVRLSFDGGEWTDLSEPIAFDGGIDVRYEARVPSEDLGVMVWGERAAELLVVDVDVPFTVVAAQCRAAVVLAGTVAVDDELLSFRDAVVVDDDVRVEPVGPARLVLVSR